MKLNEMIHKPKIYKFVICERKNDQPELRLEEINIKP